MGGKVGLLFTFIFIMKWKEMNTHAQFSEHWPIRLVHNLGRLIQCFRVALELEIP